MLKKLSIDFAEAVNFIPVFFGIGIGLYFALNNEIYAIPAMILVCMVCLILFLIRQKIIGTILTITLLGFLSAFVRTHTLNTNMLHKKIKFCPIEATIDNVENTPSGIKFIVSDIQSKWKIPRLDKVSLTWKTKNNAYDYIPGMRVNFLTILDPIYPKTFANAYDFRKQSFFNNISARGYIVKNPEIISKNDAKNFAVFKNSIRQKIDEHIDKFLPGQQGAVVKTLITGNKSAIDNQTRNYYSDAGIAHILAISGLHMGIIAALFFVLIRFIICQLFPCLALRYNIKKIAAATSLFFAFLYLQISGESMPAVRSFLMYGLVVLAILFDRSAFSMRSVAFAALAILTFRPESILFPSFQMSFSAVAALVSFYDGNRKNSTKSMATYSLFLSSIIATLATSIFSINTFNRFSCIGLLSNLLAIPIMSVIIMPLCVICLASMAINLHSIFLPILGKSVQFLTDFAQLMSNLPFAAISLPSPNMSTFVLIISGGIILTLLSNKIRLSGIIPLTIGFCLYVKQDRPIIYISKENKVVGVRQKNNMCFNTLSKHRRLTSDFIKSEAIDKKHNFAHKECKSCVKKLTDDAFLLNNQYLITNDKNIEKSGAKTINLDKLDKSSAKLIYQNGKIETYKIPNRPWNK